MTDTKFIRLPVCPREDTMQKVQSSIGCLILLVSVAAATGCFITNCPPGGKRSGGSIGISRMCPSCGPQGRGSCYGPKICCSADFGCLIGTPETYACGSENRLTTPCQNPGVACGSNGICAGDGICCSEQGCSMNETCKDDSTEIHGPPFTTSRLMKPIIASQGFLNPSNAFRQLGFFTRLSQYERGKIKGQDSSRRADAFDASDQENLNETDVFD